MFYQLFLTKKPVEYCFNIETIIPLDEEEKIKLKLVLCDGFILETITEKSQIIKQVTEIGPRLGIETSRSTNMLSICQTIGLTKITRIERSIRYLSNKESQQFDRMTEEIYTQPLISFETSRKPEEMKIINLIDNGPDELKKVEMAAFDDFERKLIYEYFVKKEKRNPTFAEILDWANANSEHCRHWLFLAKWVINDQEMMETLFSLVKKPWIKNPGVTLFAFDDNAGAIQGRKTKILRPVYSGGPSAFKLVEVNLHLTMTAETHNFPTGVEPKEGAKTGIGGMQRDQRDVRQGAITVANLSGYAVGNLYLPSYDLPWEDHNAPYLETLASPLQVLINGSNGVHYYGNESGVPVTCGFVQSIDMIIDGKRWAFQKPILYAGGIGLISDEHIQKNVPQKGMKIIQVGGPAYRVGVGGGAASSKGQGDQSLKLDFNAVQRGNAEMSRKVDRVVYACVSMGKNNPIVIAHDQGAGGMANATKEAVGKAGGKIDIRKVNVGDKSMSVWEIYVAEYQERECFLVWPEHLDQFLAICTREKAPCEVLGEITGDGRFVVEDSLDGSTPVDLNLSDVLGDLPQKTYYDTRKDTNFIPLDFSDVTLLNAFSRVLKLPSVASKRYLTKNVDRSVKGLTVQQQCCGPMQLTVADCAISAMSHYGFNGVVYALGEKPKIMIGNPATGARMTITEAILNLAGAYIGDISKIDKISNIGSRANWMWAPKLPGEGAAMYDAAKAMSDLMINLGINISGGKDSSSMYAKILNEIIKSPRELVVKVAAVMDNITKKVTPDFKKSGSAILLLDLAKGKRRLGGSALAQVFKQFGNEFPDLEDKVLLQNGFNFIQSLLGKGLLLSSHDTIGDGLGVATVEMAISGNIGCKINIPSSVDALNSLFAEEAGLVLEVDYNKINKINKIASTFGISSKDLQLIGKTTDEQLFIITQEKKKILTITLNDLRTTWEETSYHLDCQRANQKQANEEWEVVKSGLLPTKTCLTFEPKNTTPEILNERDKIKVAILREEGTNGEDEMRSYFNMAGFDVWDLNMNDLITGKVENFNQFRGLIFPGGFSYGDIPESAKGWSTSVRSNKKIKKMFDDFYNRPDSFSLGVCNGCQFGALLGWVPYKGLEDKKQPRFVKNLSGIFESRSSMVKITNNPSILFKDMEDSIFEIWVAHGEGRFYAPDPEILERIKKDNLVVMKYVDCDGNLTECYPFNPNGSPYGIAGLTTKDGRHTMIMPHPERGFLKWQLSYLPKELNEQWEASPSLKIAQNAMEWCKNN